MSGLTDLPRSRYTVGRLIDAARADGLDLAVSLTRLSVSGPADVLAEYEPLFERQRGAVIVELCRRGPIYLDLDAGQQ